MYCTACKAKGHCIIDLETFELKEWKILPPSDHKHDSNLTYRASENGILIKEIESKIKKKVEEGNTYLKYQQYSLEISPLPNTPLFWRSENFSLRSSKYTAFLLSKIFFLRLLNFTIC